MLTGNAFLILNVTVSKILSTHVSYGSKMGFINLTHILNIVFNWRVFGGSYSLWGSHLSVKLVLGIGDGFHDLFVFIFLSTEDVITVDIVSTLEEVMTVFLGGSLLLRFLSKSIFGNGLLFNWLFFLLTFTFTVALVMMVVLLMVLLLMFFGMGLFVGFSLFLSFLFGFLLD